MRGKKDILVIGSGLAGLFFALKMANSRQVTLVSKVKLNFTNSSMAQGGIAAAIQSSDSPQNHMEDTIVAGAGLCSPEVVKHMTEQAPGRIQDLVDWGVQFDCEKREFRLGQEGGHSQRRILHIADHTGQSVHQHLLKMAKEHPNIELVEDQFATDLIMLHDLQPNNFAPPTCIGAYLLDKKTQTISPTLAQATILATGGAGKAYLYTSNWEGATGDGIAIAHRAGARVANLEFMQFHPTCLFDPQSRNFLISEALRGEGGTLINRQGEDFTRCVHNKGSLAPRDIVARAIDSEMKKSGADHVYLDMTHHSKEFLLDRFPNIYQRCKNIGVDMSTDPIPVVPAAHYLCGGVLTGLSGETNIQSLFCLGETACTGLHGANRLASNSLLECLVTSHNCAQHLTKAGTVDLKDLAVDQIPRPKISSGNVKDEDLVVVHHMWDEIRQLMWNYVGIVRSDRRLERASHRLSNLLREINEDYSHVAPHSDIEELRNIATVADLTVKCARLRKESRGIHFNLDYPEVSKDWEQNTVL